MGKIIKEFSCYIPRNPNVGKMERDEVLRGGVRSIPPIKGFPAYVFAYRMKVARIAEPAYKNAAPAAEGYLNYYNDGLVFFPDTEPGFALELAHVITHGVLGHIGTGIFSYLGEGLSKVTGELTGGQFTDAIMQKMGNKKKMFMKALASKDFFFIPFTELTRFMKRTEHSYLADYYTYVLSHETAEGKTFHYLLSEKSGFADRSGGSLDEVVLLRDRLEKEVEDIALNILKERIGPFGDSFMAERGDEYRGADPERQKEIAKEYEEQLNAAILALGYTPCIFDNRYFNYISDRKLATEILERLSPTISSFKQAPHGSTLIEWIEGSAQGRSRESINESLYKN
jgi:hypothetical protein